MHQWTSDGKMASGGYIYFYQSGTMVPKTVYKDAELTIAHTNPVQLSASGSEVIFLADGAYRVWVKDQYGQQIEPWIDGIVGGGSGSGGGGAGSNSSIVTVKLYQDLRSLSSVPDTVYVCGKISEGDGGAGWFQLVPGSTAIDDDGVILTSSAGSNVYKRVFDSAIDPQWYGVRYGVSADQTVFLNHALTGSVNHNYPVQITGSVYINQNISVPTKSATIFTDDGFLTASLPVTVTYADDAKLECTGRTFGSNVSPKIGNRVIESLKLSYMGGAVADTRMDKLLLASTSKDQVIEIDEDASILASTWIVPNKLIFTNNAILTFTGASGLNWNSVYIVPEPFNMFQIDSTASVAFNFGNQFVYAEMFGAVGNGSTDDNYALDRVFNTGYVQLLEGKTYYAGGFVSFNTAIVRGNATIAFGPSAASTFSGVSLELQALTVTKSASTSWATLTTLVATDSALPSLLFTATNKIISGCSYATDTRYPVQDGTVGPALYNAHLPLLPNAGQLTTDNNGKIINGSPLQNAGGLFDLTYYGDQGHTYAASNFNKIKYSDDGSIFVIGNRAEVFRSDDGGLTWVDISIFTGGDYTSEKTTLRDFVNYGPNQYAYASGREYECWLAHSCSSTNWVSPSNPLNNSSTSWRTDNAHSVAYDPTTEILFSCSQWSRVVTCLKQSYGYGTWYAGTGTLCPAGAGAVCRHLNGNNIIAGYDSSNGNMATYWIATTLTNNAADWVKYNTGASATTILDIIYANGRYIVVGTGGYIASSPTIGSGAVWTRHTSYSTVDLNGIAYIPNDGYYVSGAGGTLLHSINLNYFGPRYVGVSQNLNGVTYNSVNGLNRLLLCGDKRIALVSK